jgi:putative peptidoglycan lipid II flippase
MLIGTTIATAAFPRLNDRLAQGRRDLFRKDFLHILRAIIWMTVPVVVVCYFARGYLARLIYTQHAPEIAIIFGFFAVAILFRTVYAMVSRWFYAQKDTKTPLYVSLFAIALNVVLAYLLSRPAAYDVAGLAMAQSIVAAAEVIILFIIMMVRDHKLFDKYFWGGLFRILSVTGFTVITAFIMLSVLPLDAGDRGLILTTKLAAIALATFATHFAMSVLFDLEEVRPVLTKARQLILTPIKFQ